MIGAESEVSRWEYKVVKDCSEEHLKAHQHVLRSSNRQNSKLGWISDTRPKHQHLFADDRDVVCQLDLSHVEHICMPRDRLGRFAKRRRRNGSVSKAARRVSFLRCAHRRIS